jgi:hypothetical protein
MILVWAGSFTVLRGRKLKKLTFEQFVERSQVIHGNKYIYTTYNSLDTSTTIFCISCQQYFQQLPSNHLSGRGCAHCGYATMALGTKTFSEKAKLIHGDMFDYSNVIYKNTKTPVEIVCQIHGTFLQRPEVHLNGFGCPACSGLKKSTTDIFIQKANAVHHNKYDYSQVNYINVRTKINIICPIDGHGIFEQVAGSHLGGRGCSKCLYKGQTETGKALTNLLPNILINSQAYIKIGGKKVVIDFQFHLNSTNYFVEYNGPQHYEPVMFYFSSEEKTFQLFEKQKKRDELVRTYCLTNNIILIEIDSRIISINQIEKYLISVLPI